METKKAKHVPTRLYKLGGRLDKQYEIVSALSDINAFNGEEKGIKR